MDIDQILRKAVAHHKEGRLDTAKQLYRSILKARPGHADSNHNIGVLLVQKGRLEEALPHLKTALESRPSHARFWLSFIDTLIKTGKADLARQILKQGRSKGLAGEAVDKLDAHLQNQSFDHADYTIALNYREKGDFKEAAQELQTRLAKHPHDATAHAHLAHILSLDNQDKMAWSSLAAAEALNPNLPVVQRNRARLLLKGQKNAQAFESAKKVWESDLDDPENRLVMAMTLDSVGQKKEGLTMVNSLLKVKPRYAEALAARALFYWSSGTYAMAVKDAEAALSIKPHLKRLWPFVASLHYELKDLKAATKAMEKAVDHEPENIDYLIRLGEFKRLQGDNDGAVMVLENALSMEPENVNALTNFGTLLQQTGRNEKAGLIYQKALDINPRQAEIYNNLGTMAMTEKNWELAMEYFQIACEIKPDHAEVHNNFGLASLEFGHIEKAVDGFQKALAIKPEYARAHNNLGNALKESGEFSKAISSYRRALSIEPDSAKVANVYSNLGNIYKEYGQLDEAISNFRKAISLKPDYAEVHKYLSLSISHTHHDHEILAMEELYNHKNISKTDKMHLSFGLGKAFEDLKERKKSFNFILKANGLKRETYDYSISEETSLFSKTKQVFSKQFISKYEGKGCLDETPIFIIGMPRSGTTLTEQIISSHNQVFGAGELDNLIRIANTCVLKHVEKKADSMDYFIKNPEEILETAGLDYLTKIRKHSIDTKFITDKMPHNFLLVGVIKLILPNAKVIHCRRDPMDNCFSIFKTFFSAKDSHHYAYDLKELGQYYTLYLDLMDHWRKYIPGFMYEFEYEKLISDQTRQTMKLLEFCGLPLDNACLEYYKTDRKVSTASDVQVRRPIYKDSVKLWKKYEAQLKPLWKSIYG